MVSLVEELDQMAGRLDQDTQQRQKRRALFLIEQEAKNLLRTCFSDTELTAEKEGIVIALAAGEIAPRDAARRFLQEALET